MNLFISDATRSKLTAKHGVSEAEVKQCFENREGKLLEDDREGRKTDPPTQWFIAETNKQRLLKVLFILKDGVIHLKTAYEPNQIEIHIYSQHG
jgi:uncharacterized DUF497 family protein